MGSAVGLLALYRIGPLPGTTWIGGSVLAGVLVFTLLSGAFLAMAGRSRVTGLWYRRLDEAVELVTLAGGQRDARLAAAVDLLDLALRGPPIHVAANFDPERMRDRLGDSFDFVLEVERALLRSGLIEAVLSAPPRKSPD